MRKARTVSLSLIVLFSIGLFGSLTAGAQTAAPQPADLQTLQARFQKQFQAIEYLFANGPAKRVYPPDFKRRLAIWQDELANSFAAAGATADEILKLNPPDQANWLELHDTLLLYAQPNTPPEKRNVFGATEVQKRARLLDAPAADYPDAARAAKATGEVRLEMVLAADGTVKNIFPMKPLEHGLTESAFDAARKIKFTPAVRNGQPVSQFLILSYEFKNGRGLPPYIPDHVYYF
jgi:TonB family protein